MATTYDHIVLGAGAVGAAAAYRLAERGGGRVLVLERHGFGHELGSSGDVSRIIRHAYHSPAYTALTGAAYARWSEVEERTGLALVHKTGGIDLAPDDERGRREIDAVAKALAAHDHRFEAFDGDGLRERWPQWTFDGPIAGLYQPDAGILDIRRATAAHTALARSLGVEFRAHSPARRLTAAPGDVRVWTDDGEFHAATLTLCVGSWVSELLPWLGVDLPITLTQEQVTYFATPNLLDFAPERFPVWVHHGPEVTHYGFPVHGEAATKAARDMSGDVVTQETRRHTPDPARTADVAAFLAAHLPGALGPELISKTCVYDMPPDRDFILDRLPGHPSVAMFAGAGHGGKFAALAGDVLAELALDGRSTYPVDLFRADRPSLTDPDFQHDFRFTRAVDGS